MAFIISTASWAVVMLGLLLVPRGARHLVYPIAALVGPGVAAAHALPTAMSADTLDIDELYSGQRQEGIYAGFEVFIRKLSTKVVLAGIGSILAWSGYVERAAEQSPRTLTVLRLIISVGPAVILVGGIAVAWRYPLTRQRHRAIQRELADRRAVKADPRFGN